MPSDYFHCYGTIGMNLNFSKKIITHLAFYISVINSQKILRSLSYLQIIEQYYVLLTNQIRFFLVFRSNIPSQNILLDL